MALALFVRKQGQGILVVDDDQELRDTLCEVLHDEGYTTYQASNGADALDQIQAGLHPCLIVMDVAMPTMTGAEFLRARIHEEELRDIPILMITAYGKEDGLESALGVLHKPFDLERILEVARNYC